MQAQWQVETRSQFSLRSVELPGLASAWNYNQTAYAADQSLAAETRGTADGTGNNYVSLGSFSVDSFILAIQNLSTLRAENGAMQARFEFALDHLEQNKVNMEAANGRINDVDIAAESTRFARYNILMQAGSAMLAQANMDHSSVAQRLIMYELALPKV